MASAGTGQSGAERRSVQPLIDIVYESVIDPSQWQVFLSKAAGVFKAQLTTLVMVSPDLRSQVVTRANHYDEAALSRYYEAVVLAGDPWARPEDVVSGNAQLSHHATSDEALERHPAYEAFLKPNDLFYGMALIALVTPAGLTAMGVMRSRSDGRYGETDLELLRELHPHLNRAARLHSHILALTQERDEVREALAKAGAGFALLDHQGQVLFVNDAATELLQANNGISVVGGKICARDGERIGRFRDALAPDAPDATILVPKRDRSELPYCLTLSKLRRAAEHPLLRPGATHCLLIKDLARESFPPRRVLGEYFTFTPTECDVAEDLANLLSINEIAEEMSLSVHTVRTHVKQMMAKSGVNRQTELVAMLREIG